MKYIYCFLFLSVSQLFGQTISGFVYDSKSNDVLRNCNISIVGTNRGTTSNSSGYYELNLPQGTYSLNFEYIGFKSTNIKVLIKDANINKNVYLTPQIFHHDEIIVFANMYTEAEQLILEASIKKHKTLQYVDNYKCKSYTKLTISGYADSVKDKYALLNEIYSEFIWNNPNSFYETVYSQKISKNLPEALNFLNSNSFLDVNSDEIKIGHKIVSGPLSPNAIEIYNFQILDTLFQDDKRIFKISFNPKAQNEPAMSGILYLIDKLFIIQEIDVIFNKLINYSFFEDIHIIQQYKAFNDSIFLPYLSIKESAFIIPIPNFDKLLYSKTNFRENYVLNVDDLKKYSGQKSLIYKNDIPFDSLDMHFPPLSVSESNAYLEIDSLINNNTMAKIVTSSIKMIDYYAYLKTMPIGDFSDFYRYNRIEGSFIGAAINTKESFDYFSIYSGYGYGISDKKNKYFIIPKIKFSSDVFEYGIQFFQYKKIQTRENLDEYPTWLNSIYSLSGVDYFDYYYSNGSGVNIYLLKKPLSIGLSLFTENHKKAFNNLNSGVLTKQKFIKNPLINEGQLNGINFRIKYSTSSYKKSSLFKRLLKYQNYSEISFDFESGLSKWNSDFDYKRYYLSLFIRKNIFFNGFLDFKLFSGYSTQKTPIQKLFELESGDLPSYERFKTFRTLDLNTFVGHKKIASFIEYNFQNYLFTLSGIPYIKDIPWDLSLIYNIGWAGDKSFSKLTSSELYSELGIGLGRIFNFLKVELLWRLTEIKHSKDFTFKLTTIDIEL